MTPSLYLLFNHELTQRQERDAERTLGADRIIDLPPDLKEKWRQVPPALPRIKDYLGPVTEWLGAWAEKGDYVLIQGDFGACFIMVNFALEKGLVPVYSTTKREAVEEHLPDGSVSLRHMFRHRMFRRYGE